MTPFPVRYTVTGEMGIVVAYAGDSCLVAWADGSMTNSSPDFLRWDVFARDWPQPDEMVQAWRKRTEPTS